MCKQSIHSNVGSSEALAPYFEKPLYHEREVKEGTNTQAEMQKKKGEAEVQVDLCTHGSRRREIREARGQGHQYELLDYMPTT